MIQDIIDAMEAKRSERLPMMLSHEELLEILEALTAKPEAVIKPVEEVRPTPRRRSKSAKKGKK